MANPEGIQTPAGMKPLEYKGRFMFVRDDADGAEFKAVIDRAEEMQAQLEKLVADSCMMNVVYALAVISREKAEKATSSEAKRAWTAASAALSSVSQCVPTDIFDEE